MDQVPAGNTTHRIAQAIRCAVQRRLSPTGDKPVRQYSIYDRLWLTTARRDASDEMVDYTDGSRKHDGACCSRQIVSFIAMIVESRIWGRMG